MTTCAGCAGSRREFVRDAFSAVVAALLLMNADESRALVFRSITGRSTGAGAVSYPVPAQDGATIDRDNQVILVRWQDAVYAFSLSCPHQKTALRWNGNDARFQCPKHKSKYTPDGSFISGRATRGMDRYPVRHEQDHVIVETDRFIKQDEDAAAWNAAVVLLT